MKSPRLEQIYPEYPFPGVLGPPQPPHANGLFASGRRFFGAGRSRTAGPQRSGPLEADIAARSTNRSSNCRCGPGSASALRAPHDSDWPEIYTCLALLREAVVQAPETLIIDLLAFLNGGPRPYTEVMEAWRTSCPRLPVWEDAVDLGLVQRERDLVVLTEAGRNLLATRS